MGGLKCTIALLAVVLLFQSVRGENFCNGTTGKTYVANPPSCVSYSYCVDGVEIGSTDCTAPFEFNSATGACDYASNVICPAVSTNASTACLYRATGTYAANPENCNGYFYCNYTIGIPGLCKEGYVFKDATQLCHYMPNYTCPVNTPISCESQKDGTFLPSNASCSAYYVCMGGVMIPGSCNTTYYFNAKTSECDYKENVQCDLDNSTAINVTAICADTSDSILFAKDPNSCTSYYYCNNGTASTYAKLTTCPDNKYFDPKRQECVDPSESDCTLACLGVDVGKFVSNDASCNSYYYCSDSGPIAGNCTDDKYFDEASQLCDVQENVNCTIKPTPSYVPDTHVPGSVLGRLANRVLDFVGFY